MRRVLLFVALVLAAVANAAEPYTYTDIVRLSAKQRSVYGLRSTADGEHYTAMVGGSVCRFAYATGAQTDVIYEAKAEGAVRVGDYEFSQDESLLLISSNHSDRKSVV